MRWRTSWLVCNSLRFASAKLPCACVHQPDSAHRRLCCCCIYCLPPRTVPRRPARETDLATQKRDFAKVPKYLNKIKNDIAREKEYVEQMQKQQVAFWGGFR